MMSGAWLNKIDWKNEGVALVMMAATWLGFFWRQIFQGLVYFQADIGVVFYPLEYVYGVFQHARQLPVWSTEFGFGHPLLAWGQLGFFTPVHVVLREIGLQALNVIQVSMMVHFALGLLGMYVWLRRRHCHSLAASLGAIVFVFNGYNVSHILHLNFFIGVMLLPWGLVALDGLIRKVTVVRTALLGVVVAVIVLSAHAQIALYCLLLIMLVGVIVIKRWTAKLILGLATAAILGVLLSSLAWLPLWEFLPYQDRTGGITTQELYNFSYPWWHAITLVLPTYFGDLESYWGANSYLELGAYVGLLPLLLAGMGLTVGRWRRDRDKWAAATLLLVGVLLILGRYSWIYRNLVERGWWPPFTAPSRWLLLVVFGLAWLSAQGLNKFYEQGRSKEELIKIGGGILLVLLIFLPWGMSEYATNWQSINAGEAGLALMALIVGGLSLVIVSRPLLVRWWSLIAVGLAAVTLVSFGWQLYPLVDRQEISKQTALAEEVADYNKQHIVPARIYSDKVLLRKDRAMPAPQIEIKRTGELGNNLWVQQSIRAEKNDWSCVNLAIESDRISGGMIEMSILKQDGLAVVRQERLPAAAITDAGRQTICFEPIRDSAGRQYWITFRSLQEGGRVQLFYQAGEGEVFYLVRVAQPTEKQLAQSKKDARLVMELLYGPEANDEHRLMTRHLNAIVGASSARWIGSISIKRYRDFVKELFANDRDTVDGDGQHVLVRNRKLFDLAGVTHFAQRLEEGATDAMPDNGFRTVKEEKVRGITYRLYENEQVYPRAFIVPKAIIETNQQAILTAMSREGFDPRQTVYLEDPSGQLTVSDGMAGGGGSGEVKVIKYEPTRIDVRVDINQASWLVLTDSYTPLWGAFVDDKPTKLFIADQLFRATPVPAGEHVVSFRYKSPMAARAVQLTYGGIFLVLLLFALNILNMRNWQHDKNTTADGN